MNGALPGMDTHEIGTKISTIFEAIQSGRMDSVFRDAVSAWYSAEICSILL